ncbi:AAA domain-containing protein [Pseudofulvibacter geojedonensis]|uniref:AAA domain-containing protein n=1 Tax=Pseudofulvibacter geojedonensis TaxID=1123758 RepID=A0ABW3HZK8_9FLAO
MSKALIEKYISYFTDCYKADNREFTISNIFSSKFENQYIIRGEEELVNNKYPIQFLPEKQAVSILQDIAMYKNDKELLYGTLFCVGKRKNFQKRTTNIIAPLFYYKAQVVEREGDYFIDVENDSRLPNIGFLKTLIYKTSFNDFYVELEELLQNHSQIDFGFVSVFKRLIDKHIQNIEEDLLLFPKLKTQSFLKKEATNSNKVEEFKLYPASAVFVSSKSNNINGVVNELELLKRPQEYSSALQQFFSEEIEAKQNGVEPNKVQVLLNASQEEVIKNSFQYNKSVIIGPPGTGKTYTISAIAQEYVTQGKSVLIATKTSQALEVIEDKLKSVQLNSFAVKVGGKYYRRRIVSRLNKISSGYYQKYDIDSLIDLKERKKYMNYKLVQFEDFFDAKINKEKERVDRLYSGNIITKLFNKLDVKWFREKEDEEWVLIKKFFKQLKELESISGDLVHKSILYKINNIAEESRLELIKLINTFISSNKAEKLKGLKKLDIKCLIEALPVWLVKIDEVSQGLPLEKELFDIVIIDEATQCDIASCLPLFQRAKKIVVAGDTNQLRHMSFLSTVQMRSFQNKYGLELDERFNFRNKSMLDFSLELTPSHEQIIMLDEHYRSLPDIISFSNKMFYDDGLRVMTMTPSNEGLQSVFINQVNGEHSSQGVNEKEAVGIIKEIKSIIKSEIDLTELQATSIGVLSPFRNQTDYLTKQIKAQVDLADINKHKIRLGTPYHFQGEERDVMLLSMVVDNNSHSASLNHLNKEDIFNVAVTRARHKQLIFLSKDRLTFNEESLLRKYLDNSIEVKKSKNLNHDTFSEEVCEYLAKIKCTPHLGYTIAGLSIDILVEFEGKYLGIDLIGYPGDFQEAFSLERYKILNRVGISVFPLSYISWKYYKPETIATLNKRIKSRGFS